MTSRYKALNDASRLAHAELTGESPNAEDTPTKERYHYNVSLIASAHTWKDAMAQLHEILRTIEPIGPAMDGDWTMEDGAVVPKVR